MFGLASRRHPSRLFMEQRRASEVGDTTAPARAWERQGDGYGERKNRREIQRWIGREKEPERDRETDRERERAEVAESAVQSH